MRESNLQKMASNSNDDSGRQPQNGYKHQRVDPGGGQTEQKHHQYSALTGQGSLSGPQRMSFSMEESREKNTGGGEGEVSKKPAVKRILKSSTSSLEQHRELDRNNGMESVYQGAGGPDGNRGEAASSMTSSFPPSLYKHQQNYTNTSANPQSRWIDTETAATTPRNGGRIDKDIYREMHRVPKRDCDENLSKYSVPVNSRGQRYQYVSSKPPRPKLGVRAISNQSDGSITVQTHSFVTGAAIDNSSPNLGHHIERGSADKAAENIVLSDAGSSNSEAGTQEYIRRGLDKDVYHPQQQYQQPQQQPQQQQRKQTEYNKAPTDQPFDPHKKIRSILRSPVKSESSYNENYQSHFMKPYTEGKPIARPNENRPYASVLLKPVHDKKTPLNIAKRYESPVKNPSEQKSKLDDTRKGCSNWASRRPSWPTNPVLDAAFEEKKRRWSEKPSVSPTVDLMLVDIDIDQTNLESSRKKFQSSEELKQRLSMARPRAPNNAEIEKRWKSVTILTSPYTSRSNLLDKKAIDANYQCRARTDSTGSTVSSSTTADDLRKAKSMGTLPHQFFSEQRSYTSLIETDLDTGMSTETPLVYETDLDEVAPTKAKSLTNLCKTSAMVPIDIDDDRHKSMDILPREDNNLMYSLPRDESEDNTGCYNLNAGQERSLSAGELRISQSLSKLSIPNWYRSSFGKGKKAVNLTNTRQFGSNEQMDSSFDSMHSSRTSPTPPRPTVRPRRYSSTTRSRSPSTSRPTTPVDTNFELPSAKLKQARVELKPMEIKPIHSLSSVQSPKKESAKEAYLRIKAQSEAQKQNLSAANLAKEAQEISKATEKLMQMPVEHVQWFQGKSSEVVSQSAIAPKGKANDYKTDSTRKPKFSRPQEIFGNNRQNSLDLVMGGLLKIPNDSPRGQSSSSEQEDANEETVSSKSRVFGMLREATRRGRSGPEQDQHGGSWIPEDISPIDSSPKRLSYYSEEKHSEAAAFVKCNNPKCRNIAALSEARKMFKSCHSCYTYYCTHECRLANSQKHKQKCRFSRVKTQCKHIARKVHDTPSALEDMSKIAKAGYLSKGRGCVIIAFSSPKQAEAYLERGTLVTEPPPEYANLSDLHAHQGIFADHYSVLLEMVNTYNPVTKFVIETVIVTCEELYLPTKDRMVMKDCSCLRFNTYEPKFTSMRLRDEPEIMILTALPGAELTENMEGKKAREISFANVQRKLLHRGVTLRHHFPDVYSMLCAYVSDNDVFQPLTINPVDVSTGKRFVCLILPNSELQVEWLDNPNLLDELGLSTQV